MTVLYPYKYLVDAPTDDDIVGDIIDTRQLDGIELTAEWAAATNRDGELYLETTSDPRAELDKRRGTNTATWHKRTLTEDMFDSSNSAVVLTGDGKGLVVDATAGDLSLSVVDLQAFARFGFTSNTPGTTEGPMQASVSGNG